MARLIDADALTEKMRFDVCTDCFGSIKGCGNCYYDRAINAIEDAPTAQAVEVVRCKECKHWHHDIGWCDKHSHFVYEKDGACHPWESPNWKMFDENDYCSYGERKVSE